MFTDLDIEIGAPLSEVDSLRAKLNKAEELKKKYKLECDNANAALKKVEAKYAELLYRTYELQEKDLSNRKIVNI
jgi:DNA repair ATPase RecN